MSSKRCTDFREEWMDKEDGNGKLMKTWLRKGSMKGSAFCFICSKTISVKSGGLSRLTGHSVTAEHQGNVSAVASTQKIDAHVERKERVPDKSNKVLDAEIRWCLLLSYHDLPFLFCDDAMDTFETMFDTCDIAQKMQLKRQKAMYMTCFGISTYVNEDIINKQLRERKYCLMIDEGSIDYHKKWLAVLVRVLSPENVVVTHFLFIQGLGGASAKTLKGIICHELEARKVPISGCMGVMCDSANVMRGQKGGVIALLQKENPQILDVGGCSMHHVHNSASKAMDSLDEHLEDALDDIFLYLRSAKASELFSDAQKLLEMQPLKFLRRVESRWLQICEVVTRFKELLPALKTFFANLPKQEQLKDRVKRIRTVLESPDTILYVEFVLHALKPLQAFEKMFQTSEPIIHLIYPKMMDLISGVCLSFIREECVDEIMEMAEFEDVDEARQLSDEDLLIGESTRRSLQDDRISSSQRVVFFKRVRTFFQHLLQSLVHYLPVGRRILRTVQFVDPTKIREISEKDVLYLKKKLSVVGDSDELALEYRQFCLDVDMNRDSSKSITSFWSTIKASGKYPLLVAIAERVLIIPHGNADTERLFSSLKRIYTADRNQLQDTSLNGILSVKSFMLSNGYKSSTLPISRRLRECCLEARAKYFAYLEKKREESRTEELQKEAIRKAEEEAKAKEKKKKEEQEQVQKVVEKKRQMALSFMSEAKKLMHEADVLASETAVNSPSCSKPSEKQKQKKKRLT